jgi:hypothetical protein
MDDRIRRELRALRIHALVTTPLLLILAFAAFTNQQQKQKFSEIDVERINVVESDGKLRLVISNRSRSIGPIFKGKPFGYAGGSRPGIIFFNDEETENGGLTFHGQTDSTGRYGALGHLSFDQYNQDQVLYLQYVENNGQRRMGLHVADRLDYPIDKWIAERDSINRLPDGPAKTAALERWRGPVNGVPRVAPRVYVGRDMQRSAILNLSDPMGRTRARLLVDSLGSARLEFLDADGKVTHRVPETAGPR